MTRLIPGFATIVALYSAAGLTSPVPFWEGGEAVLRKKLAMLLVVAGPALAVSDNFNGNNGNHFGDARHADHGSHIGGGMGGGRFQ